MTEKEPHPRERIEQKNKWEYSATESAGLSKAESVATREALNNMTGKADVVFRAPIKSERAK